MINFIKKNKILLIFISFFLLVYFQHQFMWLYHDDYGYASLSYGYVVKDVIGLNFNLKQLFEFLIGHYNVWGGRVLYFGIECLLLKGGLGLYRLVQSLVITFIFYYIYKILRKHIKIQDYILAILSIAAYGFIEIMTLRSGVFWATASVLYLFPILPLLMFIYHYDSNNKGILKNILMALIIFFASFSQEQISVAAVCYILLISGYDFFKTKKINKLNLLMILASLIGFGILMASPGTRLRMDHPSNGDFYTLSLFGKIIRNLPIIIFNVFSNYSKIFVSLFFVCCSYISYKNYKKKNNIINIVSLLSIFIITIFTITSNSVYFQVIFDMFSKPMFKYIILFAYLIQLGLIFYSLCIYFYDKWIILSIIIISIISQVAMLMAPYFPLRSSLIFQILFSVVIIYCICDFILKYDFKLIIIPIVLVSGMNYFSITRGYYRNNYFNKYNNDLLIEVSEKINNGEKVDKIVLKKMEDLTYSSDQPYLENCGYIYTWMREYYNLPEDLEIVYE